MFVLCACTDRTIESLYIYRDAWKSKKGTTGPLKMMRCWMFLHTVDGVLMVLTGSCRGFSTRYARTTSNPHSQSFRNPGMLPVAARNASAWGSPHESDEVTGTPCTRRGLQPNYDYHVLYLAAPVLRNEVSIDTKSQATLIINRQLKTGTINPGWGGRSKVVLDVV